MDNPVQDPIQEPIQDPTPEPVHDWIHDPSPDPIQDQGRDHAPTSPRPVRRSRRLLLHALTAVVLCGAAAPLAWMAYDYRQAAARVHALAGDAKASQEALGHLYAHAGTQGALVRALANEVKGLPADKAAEALRVAAQSCAASEAMNPKVAQAAQDVLPRLEPKDQLLLLANLGSASLAARRKSTTADTAAYDRALGATVAGCVEAHLGADAPERALKIVSVFDHAVPLPEVSKAGLAAYLGHIEKERGTALLKHVSPLNGAGLWGAELVKPDLYNHWLEALAQSAGGDSRKLAVALIRTRPHAGDYPVLGDILVRLVKDSAPDVRLSALHAATEWVRPDGATVAPTFAAALLAATQDTEPAVAREAWIVLGLLRMDVAAPAGLEHLPSPVAEAAFTTLARARPHDDALVGRLVKLLDAEGTLSVSAAHALALCRTQAAAHALDRLLDQPSEGTLRQLCQWRAILAASPEKARGLLARPSFADLPAPLADAAAFAAHQTPADVTHKLTNEAARRHRLAGLEGLPPASTTFETPEEDMGLAFYALAKAEKDPAKVAAHLRPLFSSKEPVWRDQACLLAAQRLDKAQATELARDLLATPVDEAMMSGAMLAGLSKTFPKRVLGGSADFRLAHPEWTEEKLYALSDAERAKLGLSTIDALTDNANRWADARTAAEKGVLFATQLGLSLRGDAPADPDAMLFDKRIPVSTVLLAMLRQDAKTRAAALDVLLGDDVRTPFVPRQLMSDWRFGEVVAEFLPKDAPRIAYWGDIHLQKLQFEELRSWHRLRRHASAE